MSETFKVIDEVVRVVMVEHNGWVYPQMECKSGKVYQPRFTATGNCWTLDWELKP